MAARTNYPAPPCPKCGECDNRIKNTYYTDDKRILRTRKCNLCGCKWWSQQYPEVNVNPERQKVTIHRFGSELGKTKGAEIHNV